MDKRWIIIGIGVTLIVVFLIIILATRGSNNSSQTNTNLVIWDSYDTEENFSQAISKFNENNPTINVQFVKKNPATYETDSINAIASGQGPDIWIIPSNWAAKQNTKLSAMPEKTLDPSGKKTNADIYKTMFLPAAYQDNVGSGGVYGVPLFMDSLSLFSNTSLLYKQLTAYTTANPQADQNAVSTVFNTAPKTWDDLATLIKYYGQNAIALGSTNVEKASDILSALMLQYGAQMNANDYSSALFHTSTNLISETSYPGTKALSFYTSFAKAGDPNYTWAPANKSAYEAFVDGKVAMIVNYTQIQSQLTKDMGNNFRIDALPQIQKTTQPTDLASYQVMTVPKASANTATAWKFINFFNTDPYYGSAQYLQKTGLHSPRIEDTKTSTDKIEVQNAQAKTWHNPDPVNVDIIFKGAITEVLNGQNPQTVIDGAAAQVTNLLASLKGSQ